MSKETKKAAAGAEKPDFIATAPEYWKLDRMNLEMFTRKKNSTKCLLNGRVLVNDESRMAYFAENPPRDKRSVEVGRTIHARYVRRPDGLYTITFRVDARERNLREQLLSEVREIVTMVGADLNNQSEKGGTK